MTAPVPLAHPPVLVALEADRFARPGGEGGLVTNTPRAQQVGATAFVSPYAVTTARRPALVLRRPPPETLPGLTPSGGLVCGVTGQEPRMVAHPGKRTRRG